MDSECHNIFMISVPSDGWMRFGSNAKANANANHSSLPKQIQELPCQSPVDAPKQVSFVSERNSHFLLAIVIVLSTNHPFPGIGKGNGCLQVNCECSTTFDVRTSGQT